MSKHWNQHIGDDQLVYGIPKYMVGVSTDKSLKRRKDSSKKKPEKVTIWTAPPQSKSM